MPNYQSNMNNDEINMNTDEIIETLRQLNNRLLQIEEYVKKQTEIPKKNLKSLEQHNKESLSNFTAINHLNSGFACPKCGEEMYYSNPGVALASYPPKRNVRCNNCSHMDYVY